MLNKRGLITDRSRSTAKFSTAVQSKIIEILISLILKGLELIFGTLRTKTQIKFCCLIILILFYFSQGFQFNFKLKSFLLYTKNFEFLRCNTLRKQASLDIA
ncbi:hypothetical protein BpHYR1_006306 [Brachionus plicatilis]|uniref:Uncharacterized protein n=1 Tax=Brachionus plicatilis TaxID=10195 RepID=A0A3M7RLQ7_BRAPC|nr:hypothetical protein BpHYR1_006306 [Brachionus plicatilis]